MDTKEIAKDACDYLFRLGKHHDASVEFRPHEYLEDLIAGAVKAERTRCAGIADSIMRDPDYRNDAHDVAEISSTVLRSASKGVWKTIRATISEKNITKAGTMTLIERLRGWPKSGGHDGLDAAYVSALANEAADEIERLCGAIEYAHAEGFEWPTDPMLQKD